MANVLNKSVIVALTTVIVPSVFWAALNAKAPTRPGPGPDALSAPLTYLACVSGACALCMLVAAAVRRPTGSSLAVIAAYLGSGSLLASVVAFAILLTLPTGRAVQYSFTRANDQAMFADVFSDLHGSFPQGRHGLVRRSLAMDEYGVSMDEGDSVDSRLGLWEEYGLPWRCFRSPEHFGLPRPPRVKFLGMLPTAVLPHVRIVPIPFIADTLLCAGVLFALSTAPRWIIGRYRRQEGRCIKCGYLLKDLPRCPECGTASHIAATK